MTDRRPAAIRKADIKPVLEAAKDAGWDHVFVKWETPDGLRFQITATKSEDPKPTLNNAFHKWEAGRAP